MKNSHFSEKSIILMYTCNDVKRGVDTDFLVFRTNQ